MGVLAAILPAIRSASHPHRGWPAPRRVAATHEDPLQLHPATCGHGGLTTALTAGGMALVVFVFAAVLMLDAGLRKTLVATGSADNVILLRQGVQTEIQSGVSREQAALVETNPAVARDQRGEPMVSKEIVVLIGRRKGDTKTAERDRARPHGGGISNAAAGEVD